MNTNIQIDRELLLRAFILAVFTIALYVGAVAQMPDILNGSGTSNQRSTITITPSGADTSKQNPATASRTEIGGLTAKNGDSNAGSTGKGLDMIRTASVDPTSIYRIGIDDVLKVEITNVSAPAKLFKVKTDGTIDFPLAGESLMVEGKTPREAASLIAGFIKLVQNPRVNLKVSEYASHTVTVWGLVDQPGEQQIQRDAVPFFVIRAGTNIDVRAKLVRITRRSSAKTEEYSLTDTQLGSILIFPGDSIEFSNGSV